MDEKFTNIILIGLGVVFLISYFSLGFYCRKNVSRWLNENEKYYSMDTATIFSGCSILFNAFNIAFIINFIQDNNNLGIIICCGIEAVLDIGIFFYNQRHC